MGFGGQIWVLGGKETGFLRQFGHQNRDLIKKPGFWKPTGHFWGLGGHGVIDISRFWCYLNVAVLLQGINLGNFWGKLYIVGARHLKYSGLTNNLNNAVPPTTGNWDEFWVLGVKFGFWVAKKPGFCDNLGIKTEI
ncbi:MAG TPA: hypothetical protein IGS52_06345 [Oscillatoriaceae cyanobacterium M33_DOE_052]|nr:hypothetical protein [Oscillatoriaceae cyanobacterium M33_DOE_052]